MQSANDVTLAAIRQVHGSLRAGMQNADILNLMIAATEQLGGQHEFTLVLLNEASAFPHGSVQPQKLREGSVILIDSGCTVHGYQSDISRSWVFGRASSRQREVWNTVKRGQEIALETAKPGVPAGAVDRAVRAYYEQLGWSRDYGPPDCRTAPVTASVLTGTSRPTWCAVTTLLEAGMLRTSRALYPARTGIRLEDCWYMVMPGPKLFAPLPRSLEQPVS
jgi:Xaa-Pro dipeptidase